jgi:hypothetical protein
MGYYVQAKETTGKASSLHMSLCGKMIEKALNDKMVDDFESTVIYN